MKRIETNIVDLKEKRRARIAEFVAKNKHEGTLNELKTKLKELQP